MPPINRDHIPCRMGGPQILGDYSIPGELNIKRHGQTRKSKTLRVIVVSQLDHVQVERGRRPVLPPTEPERVLVRRAGQPHLPHLGAARRPGSGLGALCGPQNDGWGPAA